MQQTGVFEVMNTPAQTKISDQKDKSKKVRIAVFSMIALLALVAFVVANLIGISGGPVNPERFFVTSEVDVALLAYKTNVGNYPTTKQGLQALVTQPEAVTGWRGPYLTLLPLDPRGHRYHYAYPSTHGQPVGKYDCWSIGPDGIDATKDDIGNWQN